MNIAKLNDTVSFQYKCSFEDDVFFNSAYDRDEPYKITLGEGKMIPEVEKCLIGMKEAEVKSVVVPPEHAYGFYSEDKVVVVDKSELPHDVEPIVGMMIQGIPTEGGSTINVYVRKVEGDKVTLDGNHRLAGKPINFEIKLLMIHE